MKKLLLVIILFFIGVIVGGLASWAVFMRPQVDNIDVPFIDDEKIHGTWTSVDIVKDISLFSPGKSKLFKGELYLKEISFNPEGATDFNYFKWTRGKLIHIGDKTAADYYIKNINGNDYLFLEWKSGDYIFAHKKPKFYVLERVLEHFENSVQ